MYAGDVVGGLPIELARIGHKVLTIAPRYLTKKQNMPMLIALCPMSDLINICLVSFMTSRDQDASLNRLLYSMYAFLDLTPSM